MNKNQIEAYNYYKELYPRATILFHVEHNYVALLDDAKLVATILSEQPASNTSEYAFPDTEMQLVSKIGDISQVEIIDYRNDDGMLDYPDVERIKREANEDY